MRASGLVTARSEPDDRGSPRPVALPAECVAEHARVPCENGMDRRGELSGSLPVDDPHLSQTAGGRVVHEVPHQRRGVAWRERVEVQLITELDDLRRHGIGRIDLGRVERVRRDVRGDSLLGLPASEDRGQEASQDS